MRLTRPAHLAAVALATALILGGCSVTVGSQDSESSPDPSPTSLVRDGRLTLDLAERPTRRSFGLPEDENFRSYGGGKGDPLRVTVKLPGGDSFTTPAFDVSGATTAGGGADDHTVGVHDPKYFDVVAVYESAQEALDALRENADALGIAAADIDAISDDVGTGATVTQSRVLRGLVEDWLSAQVTVSDTDPESGSGQDTAVQLDYELDVDVYHNRAADRIVQDGRVAVDLSRRPSREELGFLPTYAEADVNAEPGTTHTFVFTTPRGEIEIPSASMGSSAADGDGAPESTVLTRVGTVSDLRSSLLSQAPALGLDPDAVERAFGSGERTTLDAAGGDHYTLRVRIDADPSRRDAFAADVQYTFLYT